MNDLKLHYIIMGIFHFCFGMFFMYFLLEILKYHPN